MGDLRHGLQHRRPRRGGRLGRLHKLGYLNNWTALYCPGRDPTLWPSSYLFADPNSDEWSSDQQGQRHPRSSTYNLRGFRTSQSDEWRVPEDGPNKAITADMFVNWVVAIEAHDIGLNVGSSDGSARFVSGDAACSAGATFFDMLQIWGSDPGGPLGAENHHLAYEFFDTQ